MLKEFKAKLESDAAFRAKFADVKSEDELIKTAKAEGYDLEQLSNDELDEVAGGSHGRGSTTNAIQNILDFIKKHF